MVNNRIFYWKNTDYSSHVLHPFMYNLKLWNKLNNIIINGYKDYVNSDLVDYLSSKVKFDDLFGKYGESKNFWKYNVMDLTGYTTRYEAAIKDEHRDDYNNTVSVLTGYDGLFYPDAADEFLCLYYNRSKASTRAVEMPADYFVLPREFFTNRLVGKTTYLNSHRFIAAIYSIYWQLDYQDMYGESCDNTENETFYIKWYSHLNYTRSEYQKIAIQLWYWRDRIVELIQTEYPITKYCLDIQGNSLILVSTFKDGEEETSPYLIELAVAQNEVQQRVSGNHNSNVAFCEDRLRKPSEFWIRWKSNPIALPALDVYYDKGVGDEWFDFYYRENQTVELGQLTHTNNDCNENYKLVLLKWRGAYGNTTPGNRLPVFFDMEQSANVLAMSSWYSTPDMDEAGIIQIDTNTGKEKMFTCCAKNPIHIVSIERTSSVPSEYNLTSYSSSNALTSPNLLLNWMFDSYHYCPATGSLLVPTYAFDCADEGDSPRQIAKLNMFLLPAQQLKSDNYSTNERISQIKKDIDLNEEVDFGENKMKPRFDHPVKVCRNTNMVFSVYDLNGLDRVKCAFLGTFSDGNGPTTFKQSSCKAKTRYEFDSQSTIDLSLTKGSHFKATDEDWENFTPVGRRKFIDRKVSHETFNSYDSNDKYVMVLDFQPSIDHTNLFDISALSGLSTYSYNILGDAGYIPHFAYQSLSKFGDKDGGTAYTWKNKYLDGKEHMQFELLGFDDKEIALAYDEMHRMVVDDLTDDCKTILCPAKFMDDIYRIWCESRTKKAHESDEYDSYFANEYIDYPNPEIDFTDKEHVTALKDGTLLYDWQMFDGNEIDRENMFQLDLPVEEQKIDLDEKLTDEQKEQKKLDAFKSLLDEYYVYVMRTEKGDILNEKRYILPPTPLSQFILGMGGDDGFMQCNLNPYQSAMIKDEHFVPTQVVFAGTPNPFNYTNDGERVFTRAEELQYGNGVAGLDAIQLKIDILSEIDDKALIVDEHGNVALDEDGLPRHRTTIRKWLKPTVRFVKRPGTGEKTLTQKVHDNTTSIPAGEITVMFSHKNLDNIARYHILNKSSNLYFSGSLPKNNKNWFKYSDFKFSKTLQLRTVDRTHWESVEKYENGEPMLKFSLQDVWSANDDGFPPYCIGVDGNPTWFLEQEEIVDSGERVTFKFGDKHYFDPLYNTQAFDPKICWPKVEPILVCGTGDRPIMCYGEEPIYICGDDNQVANIKKVLVCGGEEQPLVEVPKVEIVCDPEPKGPIVKFPLEQYILICNTDEHDNDPIICMARKKINQVICRYPKISTPPLWWNEVPMDMQVVCDIGDNPNVPTICSFFQDMPTVRDIMVCGATDDDPHICSSQVFEHIVCAAYLPIICFKGDNPVVCGILEDKDLPVICETPFNKNT